MSVIAISTPKTSSSTEPALVARRCDWVRPTIPNHGNGTPFETNDADMAERHKQIVAGHLQLAAKATTEVTRNFHLDEARTHSRLHNHHARRWDLRLRRSR